MPVKKAPPGGCMASEITTAWHGVLLYMPVYILILRDKTWRAQKEMKLTVSKTALSCLVATSALV